MGYAEKRGDYWRGRYKVERGKYGTVIDASGATMRFRTKREAEQAANDAEAKVRAGAWRDPAAGRITFGKYVPGWYAVQDLAASTMQNYRHHIEEHLLPAFESLAMGDITTATIAAWEKRELAVPYAVSSVKSWRSTLHLILADAVDEGIIDVNPATRRRGRGKRAGRSRNRGPEKTITGPLGILLIAERMALLSGRDDEFVATVLMAYTGLRWGEVVGLETKYVREGELRVEWQLYELDDGKLLRCPPKDDSHRTIDLPKWLYELVRDHLARTKPSPCACHGLTYVFRGHGAVKGTARQQGAKLVDVARRAGVSSGTVSNVLNRPEMVQEPTRLKVAEAMEELGYIRGGSPRELAAHWRRSGFALGLFQPAVTGTYPSRAPRLPHPVPLKADPWPGVPVRGRHASKKADACWMPIAPGLTPHSLRHIHKTVMEELGTPHKLMDERMGHEDGSVQARYSHVTAEMRRRLMDGLTQRWDESLCARRGRSHSSPVGMLDALLRALG